MESITQSITREYIGTCLYNQLVSCGTDKQHLEDIKQDLWLHVLTAEEQYDGNKNTGNYKAWLTTVLHNHTVNLCRRINWHSNKVKAIKRSLRLVTLDKHQKSQKYFERLGSEELHQTLLIHSWARDLTNDDVTLLVGLARHNTIEDAAKWFKKSVSTMKRRKKELYKKLAEHIDRC